MRGAYPESARIAVAVALAGALSLASSPNAFAADPSYARLDYGSDDVGAAPGTSCPSEVEFRQRVTKRLGYDPFRGDAKTSLRVRFVQRSGKASAVVVSERAGAPPGKRELVDTRCDTLADTVASTVAMAIDPIAANAAAPAPAPPPPPPLEEPASTLPPPIVTHVDARDGEGQEPDRGPSSASTDDDRLHALLLADLVTSLGRSPSVAVGARIGAGVRLSHFAITGEGRFETMPSASAVTNLDRMETTSYGFSVAPCYLAGIFQACGVLGIAAVQAKAQNTTLAAGVQETGKAIPAVAVRGGVGIPLGRSMSFRVNLEIGAPLVRVDYLVDNGVVWTTSPVEGAVAIGLGGQL